MSLFRYALLAIVLASFSNLSAGQENKTALHKRTSNDGENEERLKDLLNSAEQNFANAPDTAILYGTHARILAAEQEDLAGEARALKYIGNASYFKSDYVEAVRHWEMALSVFETIGDKEGIANMLSNLGVVYNNQGNDSRALELYIQSYDLAEEISDTLRLVTALNNIGLIYSKKPVTRDLALDHYKKALDMSEEAGIQDGIGTQSLNIGEVHYKQGDYETAMDYFLASMDAYSLINSVNITDALSYLGKIYVVFEDYPKALEMQEEAYSISMTTGDKLKITRSLLALAETHTLMGKYQTALQMNGKARDLALELGVLDEEMSAVKGLAITHEGMAEYVQANRYLNSALILKDSLYAEKNQKQINQLRIQHELDNMRLQIEQANRDIELGETKRRQQNFIMLLLLLGLLSTIVFLAVLFRLSKQRKKANRILEQQNILISGQKKEITDSIHYASRIQNAVLPPLEEMKELLPDHFILYRPRDIVSGDFYWISRIKERIICVVADCTGHGVPGAFMSMLGITFLNEIVNRDPDVSAAELLNQLKSHIIESLRQKGRKGDSVDGMDLAAIIIEEGASRLHYAGANNPLLLYRDGELYEYKPDKMPIGFHEAAAESFTNHIIDIKKDDVVYAFSDGFPDQFGGPKGKKFMVKNLKLTLKKLYDQPMVKQKVALEQILDDWMQEVKQIDDILLMGIRF